MADDPLQPPSSGGSPQLILASSSKIRRAMIQSLGLPVTFQVSPFNEETFRPSIQHLPFEHQALELATQKAHALSSVNPEAFVIGADQLCVLEEVTPLFKPHSRERAQAQLLSMQGKTHRFHCGAAILKGGKTLFSTVQTARVRLKTLSPEQIDRYLSLDEPYESCGSYRLEGHGRLLFDSFEGRDETILGLPLTPLLNALEGLGALRCL